MLELTPDWGNLSLAPEIGDELAKTEPENIEPAIPVTLIAVDTIGNGGGSSLLKGTAPGDRLTTPDPSEWYICVGPPPASVFQDISGTFEGAEKECINVWRCTDNKFSLWASLNSETISEKNSRNSDRLTNSADLWLDSDSFFSPTAVVVGFTTELSLLALSASKAILLLT